MSSRVNVGSGDWDLCSQTWDVTVASIMGRPSIRTPEMIARILERVANGELGCDVCNGKNGMPSWSAFKEWRLADEQLAAAYARAHETGVEHDEAVAYREAMRKPVDSVDAQSQRTRLDFLKFRLSKRLPRDFGDRQQVEHSGGVTLQVVTGVPDVTPTVTGNAE